MVNTVYFVLSYIFVIGVKVKASFQWYQYSTKNKKVKFISFSPNVDPKSQSPNKCNTSASYNSSHADSLFEFRCIKNTDKSTYQISNCTVHSFRGKLEHNNGAKWSLDITLADSGGEKLECTLSNEYIVDLLDGLTANECYVILFWTS